MKPFILTLLSLIFYFNTSIFAADEKPLTRIQKARVSQQERLEKERREKENGGSSYSDSEEDAEDGDNDNDDESE